MDRSFHLTSLAVFFLFMASGSASAKFQCEDLSIGNCAFAVSSSGERCVLEKYVVKDGEIEHKCKASKIMAEGAAGTIETEECVSACGLQKMSVGLSTDALLDKDITRKLCSPSCQNSCGTIVDLYTKLAAEEGNDLRRLCQAIAPRPRKLIQDSDYYSLSAKFGDRSSTPAEAPDVNKMGSEYYTFGAEFEEAKDSDGPLAPAAGPLPMEGISSSYRHNSAESPSEEGQDGYTFDAHPRLIAPAPYPLH